MNDIIDYKNIHDMVKVTVDKNPGKTAYRWILNDRGDTGSATWGDFYARVRAVAKGLSKLGVKKGDRVGVLAYTRYEWVLCDLAAVSIGACTVGLYHSSTVRDTEYIIRHSGLRVLFVENDLQLQKALAARKKAPALKKIVVMAGEFRCPVKGLALSFEEFLSLGEGVPDRVVDRAIAAVRPGDTATVVYTSGTTGVPRGAMITHDNIVFTAQSVKNCVPIDESDDTFLFLPLAHVFARVDIYATIAGNITLTFSRGIEYVIADFKIARPHWFPCVPRVFEKVYGRVMAGVEAKGGLALFIFNRAFAVGYRHSEYLLSKKPVPFLLRKKYALMSKLVFSKLRDALGGRVRFCVSGAAPLNPGVAAFFHAAGIPILEGYGMTENTSFTNVTTLENLKFGTVGLPAPMVEQRIADDGEVLYRGRNVMKGYYKMPKETAAVLKKGGWLSTGDLGRLDDGGNLVITGRKKEIIITSGGKNIAPAPIEALVERSKYVNQCCLVGDRRKHLAALVTLDAEAVTDYLRKNALAADGDADLASHPAVLALIDGEMEKVNAGLASFESVKRYAIVPEFTVENGTATPTLKLRKGVIAEKYARTIDALYDHES